MTRACTVAIRLLVLLLIVAGCSAKASQTIPFSQDRGALPGAALAVPLSQENVAYRNGEVDLAGTLTLPQGPGPFTALLLVTGSGPQDRDETVAGHKPFLVLADALTRAGYAVLGWMIGASADPAAT